MKSARVCPCRLSSRGASASSGRGASSSGCRRSSTRRRRPFTVNDQKGFYHCFATGEHGDIFTFLMETEGLSFPEAVQQLASEAASAAQAHRAGRGARGRTRPAIAPDRGGLRMVRAQLRGNAGAEAREYLHGRGLDAETIASLSHWLCAGLAHRAEIPSCHARLQRGDMAAAGMVIAGEDIATPYDRFPPPHHFPDHRSARAGHRVSAGGRSTPDQPAKYLNSPETPLFHKGAMLFNAANARQAGA